MSATVQASARLARRVHAAALRLLPPGFRERYGGEIERVVDDRLRDATARGAPAALVAGLAEALDVALTAARLRAPAGLLGGWGRDLRYAARSLARRPGFVAAAGLTLALGIGANTAIFSVVNGIILRPLPYDRPDRVVVAWEDLRREGNHRFSVSRQNYDDWRAQSTVFASTAAQLGLGVQIRVGDTPELLRSAQVTGDYFRVLGARALLGRALTPADTLPGHRAVVVLSHAFWRRRFAGSAAAIGRVVSIDGAPMTVVGVMPPEFGAPVFFRAPHMLADVWMPLALPPAMDGRGIAVLQVIGRLRDGATLDQARRELSAIGARLAEEHPATNRDVGVTVVPIDEQIVGELRPSLLLLLGAVGCLLLIACANVASLFLARTLERRREVAIRLALGAGSVGVARQFLTEAMLVAAAGGALAVLAGWWGMRVLLAFAPPDTPRLDAVRLDASVLGFCLSLAALVGLAVGLVPALHGARVPPRRALGAAGERGSARVTGMRGALVVAQLALAVVLLAGAGLMGRTLATLGRVDPGFRADHLLTMRFGMMPRRYPTPRAQLAYLRELTARLEGVPGVEAAAFSTRLPLDPAYGVAPVGIEGRPVPAGERPIVGVRVVSPSYFATMGIPVMAGRGFAPGDSLGAPPVALVNAAFARRFFGRDEPPGRRLAIGGEGSQWLEVAGVVGDVSHDGVGAEPIPEVYLSLAQSPETGGALVLRTTVDPASVADAVRRAALDADPDQALIDVRPMSEVVAASVAPRRFLLLILGAFAGVALLLGAVGVYGVLAFVVGQRTRELGIRIALGAPRRAVLLLVARQGAAMAATGALLGLAGAAALTRFLRAQLYHVSATDPAVLGGVALLLVGVALLASLLPARRAASADPAITLRAE